MLPGTPTNTFPIHTAACHYLNWIRPVPTSAPIAELLKLQPAAGQTIELGGQQLRFAKLAPTQFTEAGDVDLLGVLGRQADIDSWHFTILDCPQRQTLKISAKGRTTAWLAGHELKEEDLVSLQIGYYPLLVWIRHVPMPPFLKSAGTGIAFNPTTAPTESLATWRQRVPILQPRLQRIIQALPNTAFARTAQSYLDKLAEANNGAAAL